MTSGAAKWEDELKEEAYEEAIKKYPELPRYWHYPSFDPSPKYLLKIAVCNKKVCPECKGRKKVTFVLYGEDDKVTKDCKTCYGLGEVPTDRFEDKNSRFG